MPIETWSVSKRYKEFLELNDEVKGDVARTSSLRSNFLLMQLCKKYEVVKGFSFPKKTVVGKMKPVRLIFRNNFKIRIVCSLMKLPQETIEKRRKKLEQFLQKLLTTQLENDFLVRQFLALNNRGISILNRCT